MKPVPLISLVAIASGALLASCADDVQTAQGPSSHQCFHPNDVTGFNELNETTFAVHTLHGDVYTADMSSCMRIDFAQQIALVPQRNTQICDGDIANMITRDPGGHDMTCQVYQFHHLSAAEVAALPAKAQP